MIDIGRVGKFIVARETDSGFYLRDIDSEEEVFLPPALAQIDIELDQEMDAFVYLDTKGGLLATAQIPYGEVGEYALLRVVETQDFGAFMDWGIEKDLLVPGNEQKIKIRNDEEHIVRICLEEGADRVYGTTKLGKYIEASEFDIEIGDIVKIVVGRETDLGFRVIVNKKFIGMIYRNEIFSPIDIGEFYSGVVKKIRDDGLVDISLQTLGVKNLVEAKDKILAMLEQDNGKSILHDKSSPEAIKQALGMSKKTFKSAIGMLYKDKKITISKTGIELKK